MLSFVGYGRGAASHIFPTSEGEAAAATEGGGGGEAAAVPVADAAPLVRHLPLRPLGTAAAPAGDETSEMKTASSL